MALEEVQLPKLYKNGKVPTEDDFDSWREATEDAFAKVQLNFTQLAKDLFLTGYEFDNDGNNNLSQSLQEQINLLSSGGTPITGTTADTFGINTDGDTATLSTLGMTGSYTFEFPDEGGILVVEDGTQTLSNKTFSDDTTFSAGLTVGDATPVTFRSGEYIESTNNNELNFYVGGIERIAVSLTSIDFQDTVQINDSLTVSDSFGTGVSGIILNRAATTDIGSMFFRTAGTTKWRVGLPTGATERFRIYNEALTQDSLSFDPAGGVDFTGDVNVDSGDLSIDAGRNVEFRGQGSDDYITSDVNNEINFYLAGAKALDVTSTSVDVINNHLSIDSGFNLYLDGGGDTYFEELSANIARIIVGGTVLMEWDFVNSEVVVDNAVLIVNDEIDLAYTDPPTEDDRLNAQAISKGWCVFDDSAGTVDDSFNLTSVTSDDGDGVYFVNWDRNFATVGEMCPTVSSRNGDYNAMYLNSSTGRTSVYILDISGSVFADQDFTIHMFGELT